MSNSYLRQPCALCGQIISMNGLSQGSHMKMHIKEGYFILAEWNPNRYERTNLAFDEESYQAARPHKSYNQDDYFPYSDHKDEKKMRSDLAKEMVKRKTV